MKEAIDHYNDLIARPEYYTSAVEILQSHSQRLSVGGRQACNVLRPCFIDERVYFTVRRAADSILKAIGILGNHLQNDATLRKELDLTEQEEAVIRIDSGYGTPDVSARLDGFISGNDFYFVEYNADSPGGLGYGDLLAEIFETIPVMKEFRKRYAYRRFPVRSFAFDVLLRAFKRWGGKGLPSIAIIDWEGAATYPEFLLFREFFEKRGCQVEIGSPEELEYNGKQLFLRGFPIDLIYKRVIVGELIQKFSLDHAIFRAAKDHAVCIVNGFGVQMLFKKILFSMLSDPRYSKFFDQETKAAVSSHIPWTRKLSETETTCGSATIDLVPFVLKNRSRLVLKPNGEYGGKGVLLGWECSESDWRKAIDNGLSASYVVQQRVELRKEVYPAIIEDAVSFEERYYDLDPYVWDGRRSEGCGVRLSPLAILNVSAGGGSATPFFVIRPA